MSFHNLPEPNCYKLVSKLYNGKLASFLIKAGTVRGHFGLTEHTTNLRAYYEFGVTTYPKIGKLFVFDNEENARKYWSNDRSCQIWLAYATDLEEGRGVILDTYFLTEKRLSTFWHRYPNKSQHFSYNKPVRINPAPFGTMVASSVMLIKRIQ